MGAWKSLKPTAISVQASFEILTELAALEEIVYAAAYDGDLKEGSPRKGWVKVRLVQDLSMITTKEVQTANVGFARNMVGSLADYGI